MRFLAAVGTLVLLAATAAGLYMAVWSAVALAKEVRAARRTQKQEMDELRRIWEHRGEIG